jgi:surface antigen
MGLSLRTGKYGSYYGTDKSSSQALSDDQQQVNALYIAKVLSSNGWTLNAIAGLLGNIQAESALNPGRWQSEAVGSSSAGYGLIQWTGSSIHTKWSGLKGQDYSTMDANLDHLLTEVKNNDSWIKGDSKQKALKQGNPNISSTALALGYQDFTKSTESPYDLACVFVFYRERCYVSLYGSATERQNLCKKRGGYAEKWYTFLGGKGSFGMGIQFPARLEVGTFNEDIAKTGEAAPDYIKNFYKNPKGNYSDSTYGIPNNKQGTKPTKTFGNCTAYAYGRFWEIADCAKSLTGKESQPANVLSGNAGEWYTKNQAQREYEFGLEPKLGAVICFNGGHVAIVEEITNKDNGDIEIKCSESGWGVEPVLYFMTRTRKKDAAPDATTNWGGSASRPFQGFIYQHFNNWGAGGMLGGSHVKGVTLFYVDAETIEGKGFLTAEGASTITCEITGKDIKGEAVSTEDVKLESLTEDAEETNNSAGSSSEEETPTNNLILTIDTAQKSFDFRLTGLTPLTEYDLLFKASGGGNVSIPDTEVPEDTEEDQEDEE